MFMLSLIDFWCILSIFIFPQFLFENGGPSRRSQIFSVVDIASEIFRGISHDLVLYGMINPLTNLVVRSITNPTSETNFQSLNFNQLSNRMLIFCVVVCGFKQVNWKWKKHLKTQRTEKPVLFMFQVEWLTFDAKVIDFWCVIDFRCKTIPDRSTIGLVIH